jgi:hypothetical protein
LENIEPDADASVGRVVVNVLVDEERLELDVEDAEVVCSV